MQQLSAQTDNDARTHTDSPGSTLSRTDQGYHCKITISVLPHSSRPKTVCVQNVICLLKSLCSTFTKSCATLAKQQVMITDESVNTKIYSRVCLAWTCRAGCTASSCIGLNQVFLLLLMDRLIVKNCHNLLFRQGSQDSL